MSLSFDDDCPQLRAYVEARTATELVALVRYAETELRRRRKAHRELAHAAALDLCRAAAPPVSRQQLEFLELSARRLGLTVTELTSSIRTEKYSRARHVAASAMRTALQISLAETAKAFRYGNRHNDLNGDDDGHASVIYAQRKCNDSESMGRDRDALVAAWKARKV